MNDGEYANGDYIYGTESKAQFYGLAPVLGVRFKITPRISIISETNFTLAFQHSNNIQLILPRYIGVPAPMPTSWSVANSFSGTYTQPLSLLLTFDL